MADRPVSPKRRRGRIVSRVTRAASAEFGVTSIVSEGGGFAHCKTPCPECPWRRDAPIGAFPAEAYRLSAQTAHDVSMHVFTCHMSGVRGLHVCAGFLLVQGVHNLRARLAIFKRELNPDELDARGVELYGSYRDMAIANGVPADDPAIAECRDPGEDAWVRQVKRGQD